MALLFIIEAIFHFAAQLILLLAIDDSTNVQLSSNLHQNLLFFMALTNQYYFIVFPMTAFLNQEALNLLKIAKN